MSETATLSPALDEDIEKAALQLLQKACERELVLATAESCTGGMLASLLTDVDGCAHAFDRGFVTYTDESKAEMLGIPLDFIRGEGAVSRRVAVSMAESALERSKANIALSVTGFADKGKEPGLVHFACARVGPDNVASRGAFRFDRKRAYARRVHPCGDRDDDGDAVMANEAFSRPSTATASYARRKAWAVFKRITRA